MARNRVIYQSEALFVSPNSTGAHFSMTGGFVYGTGGPDNGALALKWHDVGASGQSQDWINHSSGAFPATCLSVGLNADPSAIKETDKDQHKYSLNNLIPDYVGHFSGLIVDAYAAGLREVSQIGGTSAYGTITTSHPFLTGYNLPTSTNFGENDLNDAGATEGAVIFTGAKAWRAFHENAQAQQGATGFYIDPMAVVSGGHTFNNVEQIHRVQSANYSFTINRTDVNTFGQLARIDSIVLEPPTVNLDFTYYPTDGFNERNLGFYVQGRDSNAARNFPIGYGMGTGQLNAVSGHLQDDAAGRNFFIMTTPEGTDAFHTTRGNAEKNTIGLGNGFLSDWSMDAAVGGIPTANATVELFNAKVDVGVTGLRVPAVNLTDGKPIATSDFSLPTPSTGDVTASALRPGDITITIPDDLSIFADVNGDGSAHIQNFSLSVPLSRTPIDRLGTRFAFSRVVDFPVVATLSVSALVSELKVSNLADIIDKCDEYDIKVNMKSNVSCGVGEAKDAMIIDFKGARIDSESISSDIGSNKSVDLTFTTQIGGPEDLKHGILISGANRTSIPQWFPTPNM